jgi:hypothetical protein
VACENLLKLILEKAGLSGSITRPPRLILDLGFGCGDSSLYLTSPGMSSGTADFPGRPIADKYVGLTLDRKQHGLAMKRMQSARPQAQENSSVVLRCEDAARPSTWSANLKGELLRPVQCMVSPPPSPRPVPPAVPKYRKHSRHIVIHHTQHPHAALEPVGNAANGSIPEADDGTQTERWVMALDCLYHFFPSREEIFRYSNRELGASIMAFDLLLAPNISKFDWLILWMISLFTSAPISNFMVEREYRQQLEASGYMADNILMDDITGDCFKQLAQFLAKREKDLSELGICSFERFCLAKMMFRWFATGKVVRAYTVVARI